MVPKPLGVNMAVFTQAQTSGLYSVKGMEEDGEPVENVTSVKWEASSGETTATATIEVERVGVDLTVDVDED